MNSRCRFSSSTRTSIVFAHDNARKRKKEMNDEQNERTRNRIIQRKKDRRIQTTIIFGWRPIVELQRKKHCHGNGARVDIRQTCPNQIKFMYTLCTHKYVCLCCERKTKKMNSNPQKKRWEKPKKRNRWNSHRHFFLHTSTRLCQMNRVTNGSNSNNNKIVYNFKVLKENFLF